MITASPSLRNLDFLTSSRLFSTLLYSSLLTFPRTSMYQVQLLPARALVLLPLIPAVQVVVARAPRFLPLSHASSHAASHASSHLLARSFLHPSLFHRSHITMRTHPARAPSATAAPRRLLGRCAHGAALAVSRVDGPRAWLTRRPTRVGTRGHLLQWLAELDRHPGGFGLLHAGTCSRKCWRATPIHAVTVLPLAGHHHRYSFRHHRPHSVAAHLSPRGYRRCRCRADRNGGPLVEGWRARGVGLQGAPTRVHWCIHAGVAWVRRTLGEQGEAGGLDVGRPVVR